MSVSIHLAPEAAEALEWPKADRIAFANEDRWIGYTRAQQVLHQLEGLINYPKNIRMPNVLVVARGNNGKSTILDHFIKQHPLIMQSDGSPGRHILYLHMPASPTLGSFWSEVLWAMKIRHGEADLPEKKRRQAYDAMQYANVRIVAIDEFHHVTTGGKEAPKLLAAIKNLSSALQIPLIAAGTQAAINALGSDPQLKTRFEPASLDPWKLNVDYLKFLKSYERLLPLATPSGLAEKHLAPLIYSKGGMAIGGTVKVLKAAAVYAIENGQHQISAKILEQMPYASDGDWDSISQRI